MHAASRWYQRSTKGFFRLGLLRARGRRPVRPLSVPSVGLSGVAARHRRCFLLGLVRPALSRFSLKGRVKCDGILTRRGRSSHPEAGMIGGVLYFGQHWP